MYIVGLTGGIGSGKSTVAAFFRSYVDTVDADEVARWVVRPQSPSLAAISKHFGKEVLLSDGSLNRNWLRHKIFSDAKEKIWLEMLLHPVIRTEIISALDNSKSPYCILISPLLLETDQHLLTHRILVIDAPEKLRIDRVTKRDNCTAAEIKTIIDTQLSREDRLARADDIILNTGDIPTLEKMVADLHRQYTCLASTL